MDEKERTDFYLELGANINGDYIAVKKMEKGGIKNSAKINYGYIVKIIEETRRRYGLDKEEI